jgi:mannitol 2-dehydrogenase
MKLSNQSLKRLPKAISQPHYDRSALTPGIVHIGLGNFHRAHQSWYLHRLLQMGLNHDWAIIGSGVRSFDAEQREKLLAQDCLSTLIELDPSGKSAEVVGSMIDYVPIEEGNGPLIQQMSDPVIRIVSLTVTEGGYYIDPVTKAFNSAHPDIEHDATNPSTPRTAFGSIIAALKQRRDQSIGPFTVQSCDNLQGNGDILRQTIISLAKMSDAKLADWIDAHCTFPNSMVDCIVPATGPRELALASKLGVDDEVPVTHENFRQWVLEDDFCAGRPHWEEVGATFSDNVHGFETQKIRILNAGHQIIVNIAEILNIETISEAMDHAQIHKFFLKVQSEEIVHHVAQVPGMNPQQYVNLIEQRFSNPEIIDTVRRVAFDGSSRHPGFILPTVHDGLAAGVSVEGLAFVEAAWARMCEGTREDGSIIEANDPFWDTLMKTAKQAKTEPQAWLEMRNTYGSLADQPNFQRAFSRWLLMIWDLGVEAALASYCDNKVPAQHGEGQV